MKALKSYQGNQNLRGQYHGIRPEPDLLCSNYPWSTRWFEYNQGKAEMLRRRVHSLTHVRINWSGPWVLVRWKETSKHSRYLLGISESVHLRCRVKQVPSLHKELISALNQLNFQLDYFDVPYLRLQSWVRGFRGICQILMKIWRQKSELKCGQVRDPW